MLDGKLFPVAAVFVAVSALVIWVGNGVVRAQRAAVDRLAVYGKNTTREDTLSKPLTERAIAPLVLGFGRFLGRFTPAGYLTKTQHKLVLAGSPAAVPRSHLDGRPRFLRPGRLAVPEDRGAA